MKDFDKIRISIASDDDIRNWSHGEVKKPETINYRSLKPEKDGLFCEKIFGPSKDWECHCGKYKKVRYKGIICDRCGVEITRSNVRRERMGHIELACPVAHIWFFKGVPNKMALLLGVSPKALERVIYFAAYIVTDSDIPQIKKRDILNEAEYLEAINEYGKNAFKASSGAEGVKVLLEEMNLEEELKEIKKELKNATVGKKAKLVKRLDVVESFIESTNKPEWMIKSVLPVIPPDLRPMVAIDGGRFATADLNDLYRRVINRNNRLKKLLDLGAPEIIVKNEKRMLQESVDALFDNSKKSKPVKGSGNRDLKSLADALKGKQGRFRQNLLGKRVDYSGRSVIVVGPELKMHQCGLPKEMAIELFKPYIMKELIKAGYYQNIKVAKKAVERQKPEIWDILDEVIKDYPVLLNRAPTLHRLGIQAFEVVLVEGRAIKLHPLVCAAFNADFDGDQMPVHVPLTPEAQAEAKHLMLSTNNLLNPRSGDPIAVPSQDMILGAYYLTYVKDNEKGEGLVFKDKAEALMAYQTGKVSLQAKIKFRSGTKDDYSIIESTVGRIIYNEGIPQDLGFVNREDPLHKHDLEINFPVIKGNLKKIVAKVLEKHGIDKATEVLDFVKATGYHYAMIGAITMSVGDVAVPEKKKEILKEADDKVTEIQEQYNYGLLSDDDRKNAVINIWNKAKDDVEEAMLKNFDQFNPIYMMVYSGARGNNNSLSQMAGMRGLMSDTQGKTIETPVKASFKEGLDNIEYFISTHGARKGLTDTALRTASSGYLTRRLVDTTQDIVVVEHDCGDTEGQMIEAIMDGDRVLESLQDRIVGRYTIDEVVDPKTKEVIIPADTMVTKAQALKVEEAGVKSVHLRTTTTCSSRHGICQKCYGRSLSDPEGSLINIGASVGVVAAQAIGEPGTQLTMRTFHTGGVASGSDITKGLPRIEELFEVRNPKGVAVFSEIDGKAEFIPAKDKKKHPVITVTNDKESRTYTITQEPHEWIKRPEKDEKGNVILPEVKAGDTLTEGSVYPKELMKIVGYDKTARYILEEIQKVFIDQGIDIQDKHIELVLKQMLRDGIITDAGDSGLIVGTLQEISHIKEINKKLEQEGKKPAKFERQIQGITKASLNTESFLSAASFQETTRVLSDAAIKSKIDPLRGFKENTILGRLIPAGTGLKVYKSLTTNTSLQEEALARIKREKEEQYRKIKGL